MRQTVIRRSAARRAQPALAGSFARQIEVHSRFEPVWFGPERDRGCLNQLAYHRVCDQDVEKNDELYVVGKDLGRAKTTRIRQGRYNAEKQPVFWATVSCLA